MNEDTTAMTRQVGRASPGEGPALIHCLVFVYPGITAESLVLEPYNEFVVGRGTQRGGSDLVYIDESDVRLRDDTVSRRHAELLVEQDRLVVRDPGSLNGTYVQGRRISKAPLLPGQVIRFGEVLAVYVRAAREEVCGPATEEGCPLVGGSAIKRTHDRIRQVGPTDLNVLVLGETGTGKEVVARELHRLGRRSGGLVPVNCAAIPEGLFESEMFGHVRGAFASADRAREGLVVGAQDGTLFLDEVAEIPPDCQAKLNRVLDSGEVRPVGADRPRRGVKVRVVAATLRDVGAMVQQGSFREDLMARIVGETIRLSPLRWRRQDIPMLARHFLRHFRDQVGGREKRPTRSFYERLLVHDWPENVRGLRTTMMKVAYLHPQVVHLEHDHLPDDLVPRLPAEETASGPRRGCPKPRVTRELDAGWDAPAAGAGELETRRELAAKLASLAGGRGSEDLVLLPRQELEGWLLLVHALRQNDGNKRRTAGQLGMDRSTLYRRMKKMRRHGLEPEAGG